MIEILRDIKPLSELLPVFRDKESNYFTDSEVAAYAREVGKRSFAARYLIKSLIIKKYPGQLSYKDIAILNNDFGKPIVHTENQKAFKQKNNLDNVHISLSHSRNFIAVVIALESTD